MYYLEQCWRGVCLPWEEGLWWSWCPSSLWCWHLRWGSARAARASDPGWAHSGRADEAAAPRRTGRITSELLTGHSLPHGTSQSPSLWNAAERKLTILLLMLVCICVGEQIIEEITLNSLSSFIEVEGKRTHFAWDWLCGNKSGRFPLLLSSIVNFPGGSSFLHLGYVHLAIGGADGTEKRRRNTSLWDSQWPDYISETRLALLWVVEHDLLDFAPSFFQGDHKAARIDACLQMEFMPCEGGWRGGVINRLSGKE